MKEIRENDFREKLAAELLSANFHLRPDIAAYLENLKPRVAAKHQPAVEIFMENNRSAGQENRAVCQDTGYVQLYVRLGRNIHIGFDLDAVANDVISEAYEKNYLRKSLAHPVTRQNTKTNTPVFIHYELGGNDHLEVTLMLKGGGSENVSKAGFLLPSASREEIENWVVEGVKAAGAKACPPYLIGVGIGGTLEKAVHYSKRQLLLPITETSTDELERSMAQSIKARINTLPIGFQGMNFGETAMSVQVKCLPCHIATLPVALSIGCNAVRQGHFTL